MGVEHLTNFPQDLTLLGIKNLGRKSSELVLLGNMEF